MSDLLLNSIVEKLEQLEKSLNAEPKPIPADSGLLNDVSNDCKLIKEELSYLQQITKYPTDEIKELIRGLGTCNELLSKPVQQRITHHHHVAKSIAIGSLMFVGIALLLGLLLNTHNHLNEYQANDIKYRFLKLNTDKGLKRLLYQVDSLCTADEKKMKESVIQQEQDLQKRLELLQMAADREKEAKQIREK